MEEPFTKAGFDVQSHLLDLESGRLVLIVASKTRVV